MADNFEKVEKKTQWQKKTEEQKIKQMEYNKQYRYKKKADALGITLEEYMTKLSLRGQKKEKPAKPVTEEKLLRDKVKEMVATLGEDKPEYLEVPSALDPMVVFKMKKYIYKTKEGPVVGYKTVGKVIKEEITVED